MSARWGKWQWGFWGDLLATGHFCPSGDLGEKGPVCSWKAHEKQNPCNSECVL